MLLNWFMVVEFRFLGMKIPTASCHSTGVDWFFHTTRMSFHKIFVTCGQFLYTLYGSPFGPGAEADLAFFRTSLISHSLGWEVSNSNKYKKWIVSSYMGRPILYAHLIWNHFTAAFLRYGKLLDLEGYKNKILNKNKKWMVSSYMGRPILYAHLIWNHFTAAFSRYGTLIHFREL